MNAHPDSDSGIQEEYDDQILDARRALWLLVAGVMVMAWGDQFDQG